MDYYGRVTLYASTYRKSGERERSKERDKWVMRMVKRESRWMGSRSEAGIFAACHVHSFYDKLMKRPKLSFGTFLCKRNCNQPDLASWTPSTSTKATIERQRVRPKIWMICIIQFAIICILYIFRVSMVVFVDDRRQSPMTTNRNG